jgi:hypothetical protein
LCCITICIVGDPNRKRGGVGILLIDLTPSYVYAYLKPGTKFPMPNAVVFFGNQNAWLEVVVGFVDNEGIV